MDNTEEDKIKLDAKHTRDMRAAWLARIEWAANKIEEPIRSFEANEFPPIDKRWLAIAKTHLQQGLMALRRAVEPNSGF